MSPHMAWQPTKCEAEYTNYQHPTLHATGPVIITVYQNDTPSLTAAPGFQHSCVRGICVTSHHAKCGRSNSLSMDIANVTKFGLSGPIAMELITWQSLFITPNITTVCAQTDCIWNSMDLTLVDWWLGVTFPLRWCVSDISGIRDDSYHCQYAVRFMAFDTYHCASQLAILLITLLHNLYKFLVAAEYIERRRSVAKSPRFDLLITNYDPLSPGTPLHGPIILNSNVAQHMLIFTKLQPKLVDFSC